MDSYMDTVLNLLTQTEIFAKFRPIVRTITSWKVLILMHDSLKLETWKIDYSQ